jgi:MFS family permease
MESPMFQQLQVKRNVLKFPAFEVLREQWRKILTMLWMDFYIAATASFVILPYSVSYLTNLGVNPAFASASVGAGNAAAFLVILGAAYLSDYVGRLKILRLGAILSIATIFPYFFLLQTLNPIWIVLAQILFYSICEIPAGSNKVLYTESFSTKYRYSGSGLTYQLAGLCSGVVMALVFPTIVLIYGVLGAWQPIVWVSIAMAIPSLVASFLVKETRGIALE